MAQNALLDFARRAGLNDFTGVDDGDAIAEGARLLRYSAS
jgi:hypothetical protein